MSLHLDTRKIKAEHIEKIAYVYVRQSTLRGVKENIVGGQLQREIDKLALQLGWPKGNIRVVDEDQARSGSSTEGRYGYVDMLNDVTAMRVGAVLSLEPARVGRDSADWHLLIKMCDLTGTLIIHPNGIYDASDLNDNTMMKVNSLLAELELRWITDRLHRARRALAAKGELRYFLPIGFIYDEDKRIILDPNEDVQKIVRLIFTLFNQLGSASKVARYFKKSGLKFPTVVRGGPRHGEYDWNPLYVERVLEILHNPIYAGTYAYGRSKATRKAVRKEGEAPKVVKRQQKLERNNWQYVFHDAHPAYITWAEFLENERKLNNNRNLPKEGTVGAPREGSSLLQGLTLCGKCGKRMHVYYPHNPGIPYYICMYDRAQFGGKTCQTIPGDRIDYAVEQLFLDALKPAQVEMSLEQLSRTEERSKEVDRQWTLRLKRAEKAVSDASERLLAIDHKNKRAFARVQEHVEKLEDELATLKRERADEEKFALKRLTLDERETILTLARDFPRVWNANTTDMAMRKNLLRCLISDVTITREGITASVGIRWKTKTHSTLIVELPGRTSRHRLPERVLEYIRKLAPDHTNQQVAVALNGQSILNGRGKPFTKKGVKRIRERYRIRKHPLDHSKVQRDDGRYSVDAVASMLDTHRNSVCRWCREGRLDGVKDGPGKGWWIRTTPEELIAFKQTVRQWPSIQAKKKAAGAPIPVSLHEFAVAHKGVAV